MTKPRSITLERVQKARSRHPAGAPGGKGGEFAPKDGGAGGGEGGTAPTAASLRAAGLTGVDVKDITRGAKRAVTPRDLEMRMKTWKLLRSFTPRQWKAVESYARALYAKKKPASPKEVERFNRTVGPSPMPTSFYFKPR